MRENKFSENQFLVVIATSSVPRYVYKYFMHYDVESIFIEQLLVLTRF